MEKDLLTEDEFITPAKYNPWPSFALFYCIGIMHIIGSQVVATQLPKDVNSLIITGIINLCFPIIIATVMLVYKKEVLSVTWRTKTLALCIFMALYSVSTVITTTYFYIQFPQSSFQFIVKLITISILSYAVLFIISGVLVYIVQRSKQKNGKL